MVASENDLASRPPRDGGQFSMVLFRAVFCAVVSPSTQRAASLGSMVGETFCASLALALTVGACGIRGACLYTHDTRERHVSQ